jgi:L-asparaginase
VHHGDLGIVTRPRRSPAPDLATFDRAGVRVDVVPCYPDADATALRALAEVGARGLVLEATGAGNAHPGICTAVRG